MLMTFFCIVVDMRSFLTIIDHNPFLKENDYCAAFDGCRDDNHILFLKIFSRWPLYFEVLKLNLVAFDKTYAIYVIFHSRGFSSVPWVLIDPPLVKMNSLVTKVAEEWVLNAVIKRW